MREFDLSSNPTLQEITGKTREIKEKTRRVIKDTYKCIWSNSEKTFLSKLYYTVEYWVSIRAMNGVFLCKTVCNWFKYYNKKVKSLVLLYSMRVQVFMIKNWRSVLIAFLWVVLCIALMIVIAYV